MLYTYGPSFAGLVLIATVHLFAGRMHFLDRRDGLLLDFLAGIAVGYVFVDILPHLAAKQEKLAGSTGFLQHHIYILALAGFLFYLGVILSGARWGELHRTGEITLIDAPAPIKIAAISLTGYSFVIGCMLAEQPLHRVEPALVFAVAMGAHLLGRDHLFHHRYPRLYDSGHRQLLVVALLGGWILGFLVEFSGVVYAALFAFLAGCITIMTVIFELPRIKSARNYGSFCAGAAAFTLAILVLESVRMAG